MKRVSLIIIFSIFVTAAVHSEIKITYKSNSVHGFVEFLEGISGDQNKCEQFIEVFQKSRFATADNLALLKEFSKLKNDSQTYSSDNFTLAAIKTESIEDFFQRSKYLIQFHMKKQYLAVLNRFYPIYLELIWKKERLKLDKCIELLKSDTAQKKLGDKMLLARMFLKSTWPLEKTFLVSVYPIPGAAGNIRGRSFGSSIQSVGIQAENFNPHRSLALVFHEVTHSLFDYRTKQEKETALSEFRNFNSQAWHHVFVRMIEIYPTLIGNGWIPELVNGYPDSGSWYAEESIDKLAKTVYQDFKDYLRKGRPVDINFRKKCVQAYEKLFPEYDQDIRTFFSGVNLIFDANSLKPQRIIELMRGIFPFCGFTSVSSPIDHKLSIEGAKQTGFTNLVIAGNNDFKAISNFLAAFPELEKHKEILLKSNANILLATFDKRNHPMIILRAETENEIKKALLRVNFKEEFKIKEPTFFSW